MQRPDSIQDIVNLRGRTNLSEGYAAVFATILIWSTPSLFQYYLNRYYDPWAQNFYRYLVACLAVAPLLIYRSRRSAPWLNWRVRCCLVSTGMEVRSHCAARIIYRVHRYVLLGALRHPSETTFPGTRLDPQLRGDQLDHICAAASAHICIRKNWHSASYGIAS